MDGHEIWRVSFRSLSYVIQQGDNNKGIFNRTKISGEMEMCL